MTTKNPFRYSWFWAVLAVALATSAAYATEVNNITLGRFEDFAVVTLYGDAPLTVTHQLVEAKDGKPDRIVVDVAGATHALPDNNFTDLPKSSITSIRTSQFAVSPEPVVRIVLDLASPAAYQLKNAGRRTRVMVSLPQDPPIPLEWSARDLSTGNSYAYRDNPVRPEAPAVKATPADMPMEPAAKAKPDAMPKYVEAEKPAAKAAPIPKSDGDSKTAYVQDNLDSDLPRFDETIPVPQPKTEPEREIHYDIPTPKPAQLTQASESQQSESKAKPESKSPAKVKQEEAPQKAETSAMAHTEAPANEPQAPATPVPDEGSEPIASLTTLPPVVTPAEIVPEREKVLYRTMGRRDPFAPLIKLGAAYNAAALPDVNTLRMVGVLHDVSSSWGLFEDANGFGYILKQGDRVRNGRLSKLTQKKAFFQLTEFGWSRSVQLDLEREG